MRFDVAIPAPNTPGPLTPASSSQQKCPATRRGTSKSRSKKQEGG
jgi:hypothetical protein